MKNTKQIMELIEKARGVQQSSTREYRVFQDKYRKRVSEIELNRDYSPEGKSKLIDSHRARKTAELMHLSRNLKSEFEGYLTEAKRDAENIVHAKTPKVDPVKQERFEARLAEVKTEIMLSNAKRGKELLTSFLETVDEQAFASKIKEQFSELISPILNDAGEDTAKYRHELLDVFETVKTRSMDPEANEAMQIIEYAEAAINGRFFSLLVEEKVGENLGALAQGYVNNPELYFSDFPEDDKKPLPEGMRTVEEIMEEEEAMSK